jgi:Domain of unknown function (DUF1963)
MVKKYTLAFHEAAAPITDHVTKFGGQPVWLEEPQWPISRATGEPMRFIGQIALDESLFGPLAGRMVYLFISDGETFVDNTYDPAGGENALIVQPGTYEGPVTGQSIGPTVETGVGHVGQDQRGSAAMEYAVTLQLGEDPDVIEGDDALGEEGAGDDGTVSEVKIGGTPAWLQYPEYPAGGPWKLLLQFDSAHVPFYVNFGDAGVGDTFIAEDGLLGAFLWQDC